MSKTLPPHGNTVYPWSLWSDGQVHVARQGKQFFVSPQSFRNQVIGYALRHGKTSETRIDGAKVIFKIS